MRLFGRIMKCLIPIAMLCLIHSSLADDDSDGAMVVVDSEIHSVDATPSEESFLDPNVADFIPTDEWQDVKQGQAVPPGLHIRLNMQTGQREAKLLDSGDDASQRNNDESRGPIHGRLETMKQAILESMADLDKIQSDGEKPDPEFLNLKNNGEGMLNPPKEAFSRDELKEALKRFKANQDDVQDFEKVKGHHFRSMDELKKDFKEMNLGMKSETEILADLLQRYQQKDLGGEEKGVILEDLEYYLHQVDNAVDFCHMGGLPLLMKDLNSTDPEVKRHAALALTAAMQSNPVVQTKAVESGVLLSLLRLLSTESQSAVQGRFLYALSSLLRHFPFAQLEFIQQGGMQIFTDIINKSDDHRLRVKVVTLVCDLVVEKQQSLAENAQSERTQQYAKVDFLERSSQDLWCPALYSLLLLPDHDSREKVLRAVDTLNLDCFKEYGHPARNVLLDLSKEYKQLASEEKVDDDGDTFFQEIYSLVLKILDSLNEHFDL